MILWECFMCIELHQQIYCVCVYVYVQTKYFVFMLSKQVWEYHRVNSTIMRNLFGPL